ncbi:SDR family NAD(P)-dependent oxidoreductase [Pyxidicoccus sp. 3LFB2]
MSEPRVAVVTGAAGGIGRAVVQRLLRAGLHVVATDHSEQPLRDLAELGKDQPRLSCEVLDVADVESVRGAAARVDAAHHRVDVLVTCAGVFQQISALKDDAAAVERVLRINLTGTLHTTTHFGAIMARTGGRIVHVSSIAGLTGAALAGPYAASKAGMVALTQSHARELAPHGISVNAVLPGYVDTPMAAPMRATLQQFVMPRVPLRRFAQPDEVAEVIEFLATCKTPYLTGAAIPIDGGLHVG